jgi:hypothetical protein
MVQSFSDTCTWTNPRSEFPTQKQKSSCHIPGSAIQGKITDIFPTVIISNFICVSVQSARCFQHKLNTKGHFTNLLVFLCLSNHSNRPVALKECNRPRSNMPTRALVQNRPRRPRGWYRYSYSFFNLGNRWGGWSMPHTVLFTPGKETRYPLYRTPGPVWWGAENIAPTRIRSRDRPACSQSIYRLNYRGHKA